MKVSLHATREETRPILERALGLQLAPDAEWTTTFAASMLRRLVGALAPCSRRELFAQARRAVAGVLHDDLDDLLSGALEDLLVGGDVLELPALVAGCKENPPLMLFGAPPAFVIGDSSVRILGVANDDARFLPEGVQALVQARGGDRFIETSDIPALVTLLSDLGLRTIDPRRWLGKGTDEPVAAFLRRMRELVVTRGRRETLTNAQWLWPSEGTAESYRTRWRTHPPSTANLVIARTAQLYGNPRWHLVASSADDEHRVLDLPIEDEVWERGCDMAWSIQLALDAERGFPMRYHARPSGEGWTQLRLEFPLPLHLRRRLLHLGGRRSSDDHGFRFLVLNTDLASAEDILHGAWLAQA